MLEPGVLRPTTTALRLADMDRDGIDATVMYGPIVPLLIKDPALRQACYRAYNEWLAEFCASAPDRLVGAGLIPIDDPKMGADELRHLKQIGIRTAMFLAARVELPLWDEAWDPLWAAGAETGIPSASIWAGGTAPWCGAVPSRPMPATWACVSPVRRCKWTRRWPLSFSPEPWSATPGSRSFSPRRASAGFRTCSNGWTTAFASFSTPRSGGDRTAGSRCACRRAATSAVRYGRPSRPITPGLRLIDLLGEDRVMWASDYPHADSTWPESQQAIEENFQGVGPQTRARILCDNARELYGL